MSLCVHRWANLDHPKRVNNSWTSICHVHMVRYVGWEEMWGSVLWCCHISSSSGVTTAPFPCFCWCCSPGPPPQAEPAPLAVAVLGTEPLPAAQPCCAHGSAHLSVPAASWAALSSAGLGGPCVPALPGHVQCLSWRHKSGLCLGA